MSNIKGCESWFKIKEKPPKCGQVVLVKASYPKKTLILLAYVVKIKKREFGIANSSEFDQGRALSSSPITDRVFEWMPLPKLKRLYQGAQRNDIEQT